MHDGLAQVLGYVNTKTQAATEYILQGKTDDGLDQLRQLGNAAREAYGDVREAIVDLRTLPGPTQSFEEVLREYADRWMDQTGIATQLMVDSTLQLTPGMELQLVRIIQEALTNIRKHAKATTAKVDLRRRDGILFLTVGDDGVGLQQTARNPTVFPRFGMATMRERTESIGGRFVIESTPGSGTTIRVEVPLA